MLCDLHKILSTSKYEEEIEENKDEKEDMIKRMTFKPGNIMHLKMNQKFLKTSICINIVERDILK